MHITWVPTVSLAAISGCGIDMKPVSEQTTEEWLADYDGRDSVASIKRFPKRSTSNIRNNKGNQGQSKPRIHSNKIVVPKDLPVFIPPGVYSANCLSYEFGEYKGSKKIYFKFEISEGRHAGTRLDCYFNLNWKKDGSGVYELMPLARSYYLRAMRRMFGEVEKCEGDWLNPDNLVGKSFRVEVGTVTKDHERTSLGSNQYSKIKHTIELLHK